jgi:pilus assembly protein Flp/PilA
LPQRRKASHASAASPAVCAKSWRQPAIAPYGLGTSCSVPRYTHICSGRRTLYPHAHVFVLRLRSMRQCANSAIVKISCGSTFSTFGSTLSSTFSSTSPKPILARAFVTLHFTETHKMQTIINQAKRFLRDEDGATMVEYALMLALIAVVCILAVTAIGNSANGMFNKISNDI